MAFLNALADSLLSHNLYSDVRVAAMEQIQRGIYLLGRSDGSRAGRGIDLWVVVVPEL